MYVWHSLAYVCMCGMPICCGATCMYVWHSLYVVEQPVCMLWHSIAICCGATCMYVWHSLYVVDVCVA